MHTFCAQLLPEHYSDEGDTEAVLVAISHELPNPDYHDGRRPSLLYIIYTSKRCLRGDIVSGKEISV